MITKNAHTQKDNLVFITLAGLVQLVYWLMALHYKRIYMGDSFEYVYEATNILSRGFFYSGNPALPVNPELMTQRQPVYPLFLAACYWLGLGNWAVIALQNMLCIVNIMLARQLLIRWLPAKFDRWLLLFLVCTPSQFINANEIQPEMLLQTFTLLYFSTLLHALEQKRFRPLLVAGVWLVCGFLTKPVLYPLAVLHVAGLLLYLVYHRRLVPGSLAATVLPLAILLGYNYWNYTRTGKFHFSSNQAFNAVYYYKPYIASKWGVDSAVHFVTNERMLLEQLPTYPQRYDHANALGKDMFMANFPGYLLFHLGRSARILFDPGKGELDLFTGKLSYGTLYSNQPQNFSAALKKGVNGVLHYIKENPSFLPAMGLLVFHLLRFAGLILFFLYPCADRHTRLLVVALLLYIALAAGPISSPRYLVPVTLLVTVCSVSGLVHLQLKNKHKARYKVA